MNSTTQNPFIQLSQTSTSQNNIYSQNQGTSYPSTSYSHTTQSSQRGLQNPPLTHIPTDPLYQIHPNPNPNPIFESKSITTKYISAYTSSTHTTSSSSTPILTNATKIPL